MTFPFPAIRKLRMLAAVLVSAGVLAACGGSTSQVDAFAPDRLLSFGDEMSYLTDDGHKYAINALNTDKTLACASSPTWVQYLATTHYGKVFSQCQGSDASPDVSAYRLSTVKAQVADFVSTVDNYMAGSGFNDKDLVVIMIGTEDVLSQYRLYTGSNESDLSAELTTRGEQLAAQVVRIVGTGARVLISTIPDLGLTPYAIAQKANVGDDRPALLTRLTDVFNKSMRLGLTELDGSQAGLLLGDDLSRAMVRVPSYYGISNYTEAACSTALPNCTTDTLVSGASSSPAAYLWADDIHPSTTFHLQLGMQAVTRVNTLPF